MFCSKCGKEIADEAIICPMCGCATANYHQNATHSSTYSQDYVAIKEFEEKANNLYAISIVSAILFLGVGIIFSMIVWIKAKSIFIPEISTANPNEIAMFESAKRKLNKALALTNIPLFPLMCLLIPALIYSQMIGAAIIVFASLGICCLVSSLCTKHLTQKLSKTKK